MKKSILLLSVLLITLTVGFCQDVQIMTEFPDAESQENIKSNIYKTYYFSENSIDSTLFYRDRISLTKKKINAKYPKIELYNDSKFCLFYDITLTTKTEEDSDTGAMLKMTLLNSKEISGEYSMLQVAQSDNKIQDIELIFYLKDGSFYSYAISEKNNRIILTKK